MPQVQWASFPMAATGGRGLGRLRGVLALGACGLSCVFLQWGLRWPGAHGWRLLQLGDMCQLPPHPRILMDSKGRQLYYTFIKCMQLDKLVWSASTVSTVKKTTLSEVFSRFSHGWFCTRCFWNLFVWEQGPHWIRSYERLRIVRTAGMWREHVYSGGCNLCTWRSLFSRRTVISLISSRRRLSADVLSKKEIQNKFGREKHTLLKYRLLIKYSWTSKANDGFSVWVGWPGDHHLRHCYEVLQPTVNTWAVVTASADWPLRQHF